MTAPLNSESRLVREALRAWEQEVKKGTKTVKIEPEHLVRLLKMALKEGEK